MHLSENSRYPLNDEVLIERAFRITRNSKVGTYLLAVADRVNRRGGSSGVEHVVAIRVASDKIASTAAT